MSNAALSWAFSRRMDDPTAKAVLVAIADHVSADGEAWPSVARLCLYTSLSERAVRYAIDRLEKMGAITVSAAVGRTSVIRFVMEWDGQPRHHVHLSEPVTPAPRAPLQEVHPCTTCTPTPAPRAPTPAPRAPEPSNNPEERKKDPPPPSGSVPPQGNAWDLLAGVMVERAAKKRTPRKATTPREPCPPDWQPSVNMHDTLTAKGYSTHEVDWQRDRFAAYWSARGDKRPGWDASFFQWVTRDPPGKNDPTRIRPGNGSSGQGIVAGVSALLASYRNVDGDR